MSCSCQTSANGNPFFCTCDKFVFPQDLKIGMGLSDIPRQIAGFPEFRRAMLYALRDKNPTDHTKDSLYDWKARHPDDLGIMLLEMWAYVCDSLCFYDKVIAEEEYLRTSIQRQSLRKLVALLGYLPRPAVGSSVYLAAQAEGRSLLKIPSGTAFMSSGFDGNPPQIFELGADTMIHPFFNNWDVKPPLANTIEDANPSFLLMQTRIDMKPGSPILIVDSGDQHTQAHWLSSVDPYPTTDGKPVKKLSFGEQTDLPVSFPLSHLSLYSPTQSTALWTMAVTSTSISVSTDGLSLALSGLQRQIRSNDNIMVTRAKEARWFTIIQITEETRLQNVGDPITINSNQFTMPGVSVPVTILHLDKSLNDPSRRLSGTTNWDDSMKAELTVHFALQSPGALYDEPKISLANGDPILFAKKTEKPLENFITADFFLQDKNNIGVQISGELDIPDSQLLPGQGQGWDPPLTLPVTAYGNVILATRGQSVLNETLGSGDASIANQTFKLKNKPLTYLPAPSALDDNGVENTLRIYINGILWSEAPNFYARQSNEEIYIVRQDDNGDSWITFGDGTLGRRLPSGSDNIIANYRYGAEAACPPPDTITQITKPVPDFQSVNNPLSAWGGADAENGDSLRTNAPASVLTLGRAISIEDMLAVTNTVPGVRAAQVEWRWQEDQQRPVIFISYIGTDGVAETLSARLRSMSDPSISIHVEKANGIATSLVVDTQVDSRYVIKDVAASLKDIFTNTKSGMLAPEWIGIGQPLFLSKIFSTALSVAGVVAVRNVLFNQQDFLVFAKSPLAGNYFDFENGSFVVSANY